MTIIRAIQRLEGNTNPIFDRKRKDQKRSHSEAHLDDLDLDVQVPDDEREGSCWTSLSNTLFDEEGEDSNQPRNATKAERKLARNQVRFDVITKEDLSRIQEALHPGLEVASEDANQGQGLFNNSTIDQNIAFNTRVFKHGTLCKSVHAKNMKKYNSLHKRDSALDIQKAEDISSAILKTLGVETKPAKMPKERKVLDAKLRDAVMNDLVAFENEQAETMERMAGYWRYVNKRTYNQMVENNELWDWATGQKLLKVEEESDLDAVEEGDESTENMLNGTTPGSTPSLTPDSWDNDRDNEFPINNELFSDHSTGAYGDGQRTPPQATYARYSISPDKFTEMTRNHLWQLHLSSLSYSPGRSPGPTLTFCVPSSPSDDDPYEDEEAPWDSAFGNVSLRKNPSRTPIPTATPNNNDNNNRSIFGSKKDTRNCDDEIVFVREASPPKDQNLTPDDKFRRTFSSPATIPPTCTDISNRFGNLDCELPAPCDDHPKPTAAAAAGTPSKVKVLNLALPQKQQVAALEAEAGWEIIPVAAGPKKNKKNFPVLKTTTKNKRKDKGDGVAGGGSLVGKGDKNGATSATWAKVAAAGGPKKR